MGSADTFRTSPKPRKYTHDGLSRRGLMAGASVDAGRHPDGRARGEGWRDGGMRARQPRLRRGEPDPDDGRSNPPESNGSCGSRPPCGSQDLSQRGGKDEAARDESADTHARK
jgi:hypothetical protein